MLGKASYSLSPRDRIEHYRDLSAEAVERAQATDDPKLKALHVDSALRWLARLHQAQQEVEGLSAESGGVPRIPDEDAE